MRHIIHPWFCFGCGRVESATTWFKDQGMQAFAQQNCLGYINDLVKHFGLMWQTFTWLNWYDSLRSPLIYGHVCCVLAWCDGQMFVIYIMELTPAAVDNYDVGNWNHHIEYVINDCNNHQIWWPDGQKQYLSSIFAQYQTKYLSSLTKLLHAFVNEYWHHYLLHVYNWNDWK